LGFFVSKSRKNVKSYFTDSIKALATIRSSGEVILIFSLLPLTKWIFVPVASTTLASSVKASVYHCW